MKAHIKWCLFVLLAMVPNSVFAKGQPQHGGKMVQVAEDCEIEVPPGFQSNPDASWYDTFKKGFGEGTAKKANDAKDWQAKEEGDFNTCAAFKLLMGICWKESNGNPGAPSPVTDKIPSPGLCQIQKRNCDGVGVRGDLKNALTNVECASKIMRRIFEKDGCISRGANQRGNGRCLTNWSVMICNVNNKVGHREEIRGHQNGDQSCK